MIVRILIILLIACFVFWVIKKAIPALRQGRGRRFLPLIFNPVAMNLIRRVAGLLLRLILRR